MFQKGDSATIAILDEKAFISIEPIESMPLAMIQAFYVDGLHRGLGVGK